MPRITTTAELTTEQGGHDAAYDLQMTDVTPTEFCAALSRALRSDFPLMNAAGEVTLRLTIRRTTNQGA